MKVTALILLNVLVRNVRKFLLPGIGQRIIIFFIILLNSIFVYPNKNIVNNPVDYKSISILVTQKKGKPVLCKRGASLKTDIIMVTYKPDIIMVAYKLFYSLSQYFGFEAAIA